MKKIPLSFVLMALLTTSVLGIPQTFNQGFNDFLIRAGLAFEQFATDPAAWAKDAELKGEWKARGGETIVLTETATVFGLPAEAVTAERKDGTVQSFRVVFGSKAKAGAAKTADLFDRVAANVGAMTGDYGTDAKGGGKVFKYRKALITVHRGKAKDVVVDFVPAA